MENKNNPPKKWSKDPNSAKYHSRSAEFKANEKSNKNGKERFSKD
ncbi:hypothetical protein [Clostridium muellerianum]|nr:hypothetical protein [Clostridium muellerianum]